VKVRIERLKKKYVQGKKKGLQGWIRKKKRQASKEWGRKNVGIRKNFSASPGGATNGGPGLQKSGKAEKKSLAPFNRKKSTNTLAMRKGKDFRAPKKRCSKKEKRGKIRPAKDTGKNKSHNRKKPSNGGKGGKL